MRKAIDGDARSTDQQLAAWRKALQPVAAAAIAELLVSIEPEQARAARKPAA